VSCGAITLNNLKDGGVYNLAVKGAAAAECVFTAWQGVGTDALDVHYPEDHGDTEADSHTVYSFMVMGTDVYVAWTSFAIP
jgi:hypothetical protein